MRNKFVIRLMSLIPCILLGLVAYQWFTDPATTATGFGIDYEGMSNHGQNSLFRDFTTFFAVSSLFCLFAFFTFKASWLLAAGLIYLFALGFNIYHVMYLGGEVQTQLFVEVVLSVWILGNSLLMRNASNSKPTVKEATADTE